MKRFEVLAGVVVVMLLLSGCDDSPKSGAPTGGVTTVSSDEPLPPCCALPKEDAAAPVAATPPAPPASPASPAPTATNAPQDAAATAATAAEGSNSPAFAQPARVSEWTEPAEREAFDLDFTLTDQDGNVVKLADLRGKPFAVTFMFTTCTDPDMCPMIVVHTAKLQREVAAAGLGDDVRLLLISYDPMRDTPERLHKYGSDRGIRFNTQPQTLMLRPDKDQYRRLITEFAIDVRPSSDGSFAHRRELLLVDHEGRFVRDYQAYLWDNKAVVADFKKLLEEKQAAATAASASKS